VRRMGSMTRKNGWIKSSERVDWGGPVRRPNAMGVIRLVSLDRAGEHPAGICVS
jgi:hypothetical protein